MDSSQAGRHATPGPIGTRFERVEWVEETGSTNTDLLARAAAGEAEGVVRVAEHQTAGKGTRGRTWIDTPGAQLMVSVLLRPTLAPAHLGRLTMAWAVAAAEACAAVTGVAVRLKWPNDVYDPAGERKVAGVLAESQLGAEGRVDAVVIGMGMNCNGGVPEGLSVPGVSLAELCGRPVDREELLVELLARFDDLYGRVEAPDLVDRYRRHSATIGRRVRIVLPDGARVAVARDVTAEGHLVAEVDGRLVSYAAADVVHLRAGDR